MMPAPKDSGIKAIDKIIESMRKELDGKIDPKTKERTGVATFDQKLNFLKVAVNWEKTKHAMKQGDEGSFFGEKDDDEPD